MGNPYGALFVDESSVLDEQVSVALRGVVQFARGGGRVIPAEGFGRLSLTRKIVAFALSKFAIVRSGEVPDAKATATSKEYAQAVGADLKTCQDLLCRLQRKHIVVRDGVGYGVLPATVQKAVQMLAKDVY